MGQGWCDGVCNLKPRYLDQGAALVADAGAAGGGGSW